MHRHALLTIAERLKRLALLLVFHEITAHPLVHESTSRFGWKNGCRDVIRTHGLLYVKEMRLPTALHDKLLVELLGFEPSSWESKSQVRPIYHSSIAGVACR